MITPHYDIDVELTGTDGNVFALIGEVKSNLIEHTDITQALLTQFVDEVTSAYGYDDALLVIMEWVNVT